MSAFKEPSSLPPTQPSRKHRPLLRLLFVSYVTTAIASFAIVFAAYCYAKSYDPWLTPRHTLYMRLWWAVSQLLGPIAVHGFLAGLVFVLGPLEWSQRKYVWMSVGLFALVGYLSGS